MAKLSVNQFSVQVHLGCTAEERMGLQEVRFSLTFEFSTPPQACQSDQLGHTICYAKVCDSISAAVKNRPFATIEAMWAVAAESVRPYLTGGTHVVLTLHKVRPPIDGLLGGVTYEDEIFPHD